MPKSKEKYTETENGRIYPDGMFLRTQIAKATDEENDITYEVSANANGVPLVKSSKTGKTFLMTPQDLVELAIKNGINDE